MPAPRRHLQHYVRIRQAYLRKGDDPNLWRVLYNPDAGMGKLGKGAGSRLLRFVAAVPLLGDMMGSGAHPLAPAEAGVAGGVGPGPADQASDGHVGRMPGRSVSLCACAETMAVIVGPYSARAVTVRCRDAHSCTSLAKPECKANRTHGGLCCAVFLTTPTHLCTTCRRTGLTAAAAAAASLSRPPM
jgi:hypothetical protein